MDTNEAEKSVSSFQRLKQEWYILGAEKVSPISLVSLMNTLVLPSIAVCSNCSTPSRKENKAQ